MMLILFLLAIPAGYGIFYLFTRLAKDSVEGRKNRDIAGAFNKLVVKHRMLIEHREILNDIVIAMDRRTQRMLIVDHSGTLHKEICIPLEAIMESRIVEERNEDGMIDRVLLKLTCTAEYGNHNICFFDHNRDPLQELLALSRKAHYWKGRIEMGRKQSRWYPETEYVL